MTVKPISRELAEQALAAITDQYKVYIEADGAAYAPKLVEAWTGEHWAICWDGGPFEWALNSPQGGVDEELSALKGELVETLPAENFPEGVFVEPYCGTVLCLYPTS
jgi:hypothetical protein